MREDREWVFVYGTLRADASNAHRMEGGEFYGRGTVCGRLYQVSWYPALVTNPDERPVVGELWRVDTEHLGRLDAFEGLPCGELRGAEYERRRIMVNPEGIRSGGGRAEIEVVEAWAWVWVGGEEGLPLIASGDWLDVERANLP